MVVAGLPHREGCFPIGPRARVRVTGPDRVRYLNGQLTRDAGKLSASVAVQALLLTVKGKLCAPVFVWVDGESILLDSDPELGGELLARVSRYAVADDVEFEDASVESAGWHITGSPDLAGLQISRLGVPGCDRSERPAGLREFRPDEVAYLRIVRGFPVWGAELDSETLPHEAGLERDWIDFHKGCYVGQEVVSRLESIGRANRVLRAFTGDFPPRAGLVLAGPSGEAAGTLTSAAPNFGLAGSVALGYLSRRTTETRFHLLDGDGALLGECEAHENPLVP